MADAGRAGPKRGTAKPMNPAGLVNRDAPAGAPRGWTAQMRAVTRRWSSNDADAGVIPAPRHSGIVDCALYVDGKRQPGSMPYAEALAEARRTEGAFVWLGIHQPSDAEMAGVAEAF